MKDYKVEVRIKNNYLYQAIKRRGIPSVSELSRRCGVGEASIHRYMGLKQTPYTKSGEYREDILVLSEYLNEPIFALFPEQHLQQPLKSNSGEFEASFEEVQKFISGDVDPLLLIEKNEMAVEIEKTLKKLTPRQQDVIKKRFFEGRTLEEVAIDYNVTRERVRQLECKAIRFLKHPKNSTKLREVYFNG